MSGYACVDANIAVKWVCEEEDSATADQLYRSCTAAEITLIAPPHFPAEVTNAIWRKTLRGLLTQAEAERAALAFLDFTVQVAFQPALHRMALDLASQFNRSTVYDTYYVALAAEAGCDFWTADEKLVNVLSGRLPYVKLLANFAV